MRLLAVLILLLAIHLPAWAGVLPVPSTYGTIGAALSAAGPGDEVVVAAGTYAPSTNGESFPLLVPDGIVLRSDGVGECILDAESTAGVMELNGPGVSRVTGFTMTGGWALRGGAVQITAGSHEIDHNRLLSNGARLRGSGINVEGLATPWLHHNIAWENFDTDLVHSGDPHGFQHGGDSGGLVEHNLIGRTDSNGLFVFENGGPVVRHNILFDNGIDSVRGRGICFDGNAVTVIAYNLFFGNSISSLVMRNTSGVFQNVDATTANNFFPSDGVYGNLDGDPLLANPVAGDFRLLPGSPAIDAGDPSLPGDPDGSTLDIGPLVFDPAVGVTPQQRLLAARLLPNLPNPFNPRTSIYVESAGSVMGLIDLFDARGRHVRSLYRGALQDGRNEFVFDGLNDNGSTLASGVYHVRLLTSDGVDSQKITLVR